MKKQNKEFDELAKIIKTQVVSAIDSLNPVLAQRIGAAMQEAFNNVSLTGDDPVEKLPPKLRRKLKHPKAFREAYNRGFITFENDAFVQHFPNGYVLAAFFGFCFCNDKWVRVGKRLYAKHRGYGFPETELQKLFGVRGLRNKRNKMLNRKFSERYEEFEYLIVMK